MIDYVREKIFSSVIKYQWVKYKSMGKMNINIKSYVCIYILILYY